MAQGTRTYARSFSGGEVTPEFYGRLDDAKYQTGLALCRNFMVLPHGPAANRPGTRFVRAVKTVAKRTRLIPFSYSTDQTMVLEFGDGYIRFHTLGATLESSPGVAYEIVSPYVEADLFKLKYVQSNDVMTITGVGYAPRELRRLAALNWTLTAITFASSLAAPGSPSAVATSTGGTLVNQSYVVTAVGVDGFDESIASAVASCSNNLLAIGAYNTISWSAVTGAQRYNVYKLDNGLYGLVGQTTGLNFVDDNITADVSSTPPTGNNPFSGANDYPGAVSYFEQRRVFGGSINRPQNVWGTKSGTESNLNYSIPVRDDDALSFRIAAREANIIRHIVPMQDMILLTSAAEWRVSSTGGALTPTTISAKPQSYIGASDVTPQIVNSNLIFAAARGGHVREFVYTSTSSGYSYTTGDLCLRAPHLFDGLTISDLAYAKSPTPTIWAISSNGKLLGLTYVPEQQVGAWHQHDTDGLFESCCVVSEGETDALYVVVKRTINGSATRYVERFASRAFATMAEAYFVDAGVSYDGAPISTINSGLSHLEGKTVSILGDGAVRPQAVVTGGVVNLDAPASKIQIGLPITADLGLLPAAFQMPGFGQGRAKNVNQVWLRVFESSGIFAGPSLTNLTEAKIRTSEPFGTPPALQTREIGIAIGPSWNNDGAQVYIRQSDPLPLTIVSVTLDLAVGG